MQFLNRYANSTARQKVEKKFPRSLIVKTRRSFFFAEPPKICRSGKSFARLLFALSEFNTDLPFFPHNETERLLSQHIRNTPEAPIYTESVFFGSVNGSLALFYVVRLQSRWFAVSMRGAFGFNFNKTMKFMFAGIIRLQSIQHSVKKGFLKAMSALKTDGD